MLEMPKRFLHFCLLSVVWALVVPVAQADQQDPVILMAGDVAQCDVPGAAATAQLLQDNKHSILALGDLAYPNGSVEDYARCYAPHWGPFKPRTYPAPGNHEYGTPGASGYFQYFGARAGEPGKGYYSFNLGTWHIISLNSNRELELGTPQLEWLEADLRQHRQRCVLAYWHHPRFSSGPHGPNAKLQAIWSVLAKHGVSVVVTGHDHLYERFAPLNAEGRVDAQQGIRSFVAGTGGAKLYEMKQRHPASEIVETKSWGVLKMTLRDTHYEWEFLPVAGATFRDAGSGQCNKRQ